MAKQAQVKAARERAVRSELARKQVLLGKEAERLHVLEALEAKRAVKMVKVEDAAQRRAEQLQLRIADSQLTFSEKRDQIKRNQRASEHYHALRVERSRQHAVRTDALNAARRRAKELRKVQAQKLQVAQVALKERQEAKAVELEKSKFRELSDSLAALRL
eukprot:SAG11_NODE_6100_length_1388_cov_1.259891_4_plen_160_part_01